MNNTALLREAFGHYQGGRLDSAATLCRRALALEPAHADALHLLGLIAHRQGRTDEACSYFDQAIGAQPSNPLFHFHLASVYLSTSRWEGAARAFDRAIRLKPDYAEAHLGLGTTCHKQGDLAGAIKAHEAALNVRPEPSIWLRLATLKRESGDYEGALECCREALHLQQDSSQAHYEMCRVFIEQGEMDAAVQSCRAAIEANPGDARLYYNLGVLQQQHTGDFEQAVQSYYKALELNPELVKAHCNLLFTLSYYVLRSPADTLEAHRRWDRMHGAAGRKHRFRHRSGADAHKRLRIGYVSPDFRRHAVSRFFEPLLQAHDRREVEVYCYAEVAAGDEVTRRLAGQADAWRQTAGRSDAEVARQIHDDGIDVLIDLAGHTGGNRLQVFTYKPAPIQATYLGYCTTTGLEAMDYWITDRILLPPETIEQASEEMLRLPRCWVCYRPEGIPAEPPHATGQGGVTFGSFNHPLKLTPEVVRVWSAILDAVPEARLLLKTPQNQKSRTMFERVVAGFASHGIAQDRLELRPYTTDYLHEYADVDIALDPFPRTGGATTADALWMGVPVVTLTGARAIERQGASMLNAVGHPDLVAEGEDEYINKAVALAEDHERRLAVRAGLHSEVADSQLADAAGLAHALESAYRDMWQRYAGAGTAPRT